MDVRQTHKTQQPSSSKPEARVRFPDKQTLKTLKSTRTHEEVRRQNPAEGLVGLGCSCKEASASPTGGSERRSMCPKPRPRDVAVTGTNCLG